MDFIFMLTRQDQTIADYFDVLETAIALGLQHIGFKDIGVDGTSLRELNQRIQQSGASSYMEVVSTSREACLQSARIGLKIGVDCLLGGTEIDAIQEVLGNSGIRYYPFAGLPYDHPTKLGGDAALISEHCRLYMSKGCAGVDLLAYRATEAQPLELVRAARQALGEGVLIVAGSVDSPAKIADLAAAGADAFTIGSAVFDGSFAPRMGSLRSQLQAVLDACQIL